MWVRASRLSLSPRRRRAHSADHKRSKGGRLLNLLTFFRARQSGVIKGRRERQRATPFIISPFSSSSPDSVLLKTGAPESASRTHFSLKDGLGPACLRVSKHRPKGSKAAETKGRDERTLFSDAQITIAPHPPPLPATSFNAPKSLCRLKKINSG